MKYSEFDIEKPVADKEERSRGTASLGEFAIGIAKRLAPKRAFVDVDLRLRWAEVVGADLAGVIMYEGIRFPTRERIGGVLQVSLKAAAYAGIAQYEFPKIIDRVNSVFGYGVVAQVRVK